MKATCAADARMGIREYFDVIFHVMRSPARHFEQVALESGSRRALFFLMISGIFYCSVSMTYFFENSLFMGVVMMVNAVLMPALGAAFSFILLGMTGQGKVPYGKVFNVYAYASGAVMVISWIPGLAIVMEPVRAVLVGVGLFKVAQVSKIKAALIVISTAFLLLVFFWAAAPLVLELRTVFL
nr:YIP1 family protein [uncultured Pseudodesulfovibrio sp.]